MMRTEKNFIATMPLIPFVLSGKSLPWEAEKDETAAPLKLQMILAPRLQLTSTLVELQLCQCLLTAMHCVNISS